MNRQLGVVLATGHVSGGLTIQNKHKGSTSASENVSTSTLEHRLGAFLLENPLAAMESTLVETFVHRLFRLHLETATNGVEGIGDEARHDDGKLGTKPLGCETDGGDLLVPRVQALDRVVQTKLHTTVRDDTSNGNSEAVVEGENTLGTLGSLDKAVSKTSERLLATADVRGQTGTRIVEGIDKHEGETASETARKKIHGKKRPEIGLWAVAREEVLDGVLGGQVQGLGGEISDTVCEVATPEGLEALFGPHAGKAIHDARVAGDLAGDNLGVCILGLDDQLDTLDRGSEGLGDRAGNASGNEVLKGLHDLGFLLQGGGSSSGHCNTLQ